MTKAAPVSEAPGGGGAMPEVADELWLQGVLEYLEGQRCGRAARGLSAFEASVEADPSDSQRHFFVATLRALHGRAAEAEKSYEAAIAAAPGTASRDAFLELVLFLEAQGHRARAHEVAERAIAAGVLWADSWQRPPIFVAGLRSKPWWDREDFPWAARLEAAFGDIRSEMMQLSPGAGSTQGCGSATGPEAQMPGSWPKVGDERASQDGDIIAPGGEWREYVVYGAQPDSDAKRCLPCTCALLEELLPGAVAMAKMGAGEIIFSALAPGTRLVPHCASSNTRLTCHLGLFCPPGPRLRVGQDWGGWEEGRCLFFDDSFEHEVVHEGTLPRVVLLIRFWHPDLPSERWMDTLNEGMEQFNAMQQRRTTPPVNPGVLGMLRAKQQQQQQQQPAPVSAGPVRPLDEAALDSAVATDNDLF